MATRPPFEERQWLLATFGGAACVLGCGVGLVLVVWAGFVIGGRGVWLGMGLLALLLVGLAAFVVQQRLSMHLRDGVLQVDSGRRHLRLDVGDMVAVDVVEPGQWTNVLTGESRGMWGWDRPLDRRDFFPGWFGPTWAPVNIPQRNVFSVAGYGMVRIVLRDREIWIRSFRPNQLQAALRTAMARADSTLNGPAAMGA